MGSRKAEECMAGVWAGHAKLTTVGCIVSATRDL